MKWLMSFLMIGLCVVPAGAAVKINEIRIDQTGTDNDEYFELSGTAGESLNNLTYIVIGDSGTAGDSGVIEVVVNLTGYSIPADDSFFLAAESTFTLAPAQVNLTTTLNFENSDNVTHLLVSGFTGANGQDLDTNNDGVLDSTPWASQLDRIAVIEEINPPQAADGEYHYGPPTVGPDGTFAPGHVYRSIDGGGTWTIGPFDPATGRDTPGISNATVPLVAMGKLTTMAVNATNVQLNVPGGALEQLCFTGGTGSLTVVITNLTTNGVLKDGAVPISTVPYNVAGTLTYTPTTNFSGLDTFDYKVRDGAAQESDVVTQELGVQSNKVLISEVMHSPSGDDRIYEYVEVYNYSGAAVTLTRLDTTRDVGYNKPTEGNLAVSIPAGAVRIIAPTIGVIEEAQFLCEWKSLRAQDVIFVPIDYFETTFADPDPIYCNNSRGSRVLLFGPSGELLDAVNMSIGAGVPGQCTNTSYGVKVGLTTPYTISNDSIIRWACTADITEGRRTGVSLDTGSPLYVPGLFTNPVYDPDCPTAKCCTCVGYCFNMKEWECVVSGGNWDDSATCQNPGQSTGECPITCALIINELDYDQTSTDTLEFIELKGTPNASLTGWTLEFFNGADFSGNNIYRTVDLSMTPGGTVPADGYLVIGSALVPEVDYYPWVSNGIQNGGVPNGDGIVLLQHTTIVEALSYAGTNGFTAVGGIADGTFMPDIGVADDTASALQKIPDGQVWTKTFNNTPGEMNFDGGQAGACCNLDLDTCALKTPDDCAALGSGYEFLGIGTLCNPNPCQQPCSDCGPGSHWIDSPECPVGVDNMPSAALVGIDTDFDCVADTSMVLSGPVKVNRSAALDDSAQFPGLRPVDLHLDVIDTEIVSMSLTWGGVTLTAGAGLGATPLLASLGAIAEQAGDPTLADSFFDVFFEVDLGGGLLVYNHAPLHVTSGITCVPPDATYIHPVGCLPLYSDPVDGILVANLVSAEHDTFPAPGACCLPDGSCLDNIYQGTCIAVLGGTWGGQGSLCPTVSAWDDAAAACFDGPVASVATGCEAWDLNTNGHVDLYDFYLYQQQDFCVKDVVGACCLPDGSCAEISQWECETFYGPAAWEGVGVLCGSVSCTALPPGTILINEIWADDPLADTNEFIELYSTSVSNLAGYSLIIVDGDTDGDPASQTYRMVNLRADFTASHQFVGGYFVMGTGPQAGPPVADVDLDLVFGNGNTTPDEIQNDSQTYALVPTADIAYCTSNGVPDPTCTGAANQLTNASYNNITAHLIDSVATRYGLFDHIYFYAPLVQDGFYSFDYGQRIPNGTDTNSPPDWETVYGNEMGAPLDPSTPGAANGSKIGACCNVTTCSQVTQSACTGTFVGFGIPCTPNPCECKTVAQAKAGGANQGVRICDVVISSDTDMVNSVDYISIHAQDGTGGITIFGPTAGMETILSQVGAGDQADLVGVTTEYYALFELGTTTAAPILVRDAGFVGIPAATPTTAADYQDGSGSAEGLESKLVSLANASFTDRWTGSAWTPITSGELFAGQTNYRVTTDGGTTYVTVRVSTDSLDLVGETIPTDPRALKGIFSQYDGSTPYNGDYQLLLRSTDDITP